jgi:hypothetical protein
MEKNISISIPAIPGACEAAAEFFNRMGGAVLSASNVTPSTATPPNPEDTTDIADTMGAADTTGATGAAGPPDPENTVELGAATKEDPTLVPWDKRIHQDAKDKKYKGTNIWKTKNGLDPAVLAAVVAELKGATAPPDTSGGPGGPGSAAETDGTAGGEEITFAKLMQDFTAAVRAGKITKEQETAELPQFGITVMPDLLKPEFKDLIKPVYDHLAAIWNNTQ